MMFKVVQCPECGTVQSSTAESSFKCLRCGKSKKAQKLKILKTFGTGKEAALFVQEYQKQKWESSKEWENGP